MKVRAIESFGGIVSMCVGEELDLEQNLAKDLIKAKLVEEVKTEAKEVKKTSKK